MRANELNPVINKLILLLDQDEKELKNSEEKDDAPKSENSISG